MQERMKEGEKGEELGSAFAITSKHTREDEEEKRRRRMEGGKGCTPVEVREC